MITATRKVTLGFKYSPRGPLLTQNLPVTQQTHCKCSNKTKESKLTIHLRSGYSMWLLLTVMRGQVHVYICTFGLTMITFMDFYCTQPGNTALHHMDIDSWARR